jgi:peroxiredoxin
MTSMIVGRASSGSRPGRGAEVLRWLRNQYQLVSLSVLLALMSVIVIGLVLEVRTLRPQVKQLELRKIFPYVGQLVPTVRTVTATGDSVVIGETSRGRSQVLFFLSTSCSHCLETLPMWALSRRLTADSASRFDVYGISLSSADSTTAFSGRHAIPFPLLRIEDRRSRLLYRVKGVPMTLVVDAEGQITYVKWAAIASKAQMDSVYDAAVRTATGRAAKPDSIPVIGAAAK